MMAANKSETGTTFDIVSDVEIVMTRVFEAPRELVFEACSDARHLPNWWGPRGYTMPVCEMDLRPGGAYRFVQRSTSGDDFAFHGVFRDIQRPIRLVMTQIYDPYPNDELLVTLTFDDLGEGRTRLTDHMRFGSIESRDANIAAGMERGARESYERLAELVETIDRGLRFERIFDAPRELVFDVWTDPKHVAQWWGPTGFTNTVTEMDVRPGGVWRFVMHGPDGVDYPNRITFVDVDRPARLEYLHAGDSAEQDKSDFRGIVVFDDTGDGRTRLTMRTVFPSAAVREMVKREYHAEEGGNQTLDRLGTYLAGLR